MNNPAQEQQRKQALSDFLMNRRSRLLPEQVGLPRGTRRRTPGLRRDEVAQLAGVSVDWYTWLEHGRSIRVSTQVLESLVQALRLNHTEREYLFLLAHQQPPPPKSEPTETASPHLQHFLDQFGTTPAHVVDQRWNLIAWNEASRRVLFDYETVPPEERNLAWIFFAYPTMREMRVDWEKRARRIVAQLRADCARLPGDPQLIQLVAKLQDVSQEFRLWWPNHEVMQAPEKIKEYNHPQLGQIVFEYLVFQLYGTPDLRVTVYTPDGKTATASKIGQFLQTSGTVAVH